MDMDFGEGNIPFEIKNILPEEINYKSYLMIFYRWDTLRI